MKTNSELIHELDFSMSLFEFFLFVFMIMYTVQCTVCISEGLEERALTLTAIIVDLNDVFGPLPETTGNIPNRPR